MKILYYKSKLETQVKVMLCLEPTGVEVAGLGGGGAAIQSRMVKTGGHVERGDRKS